MKILLALGMLMVSQVALADAMGKLAAMYGSHSATTSGVTGSSSRIYYDVNLDYRFSGGGWVLGGTYQGDSSSVSGAAGSSRTSYGVTGGWVDRRDSGFLLLATFFVSSSLDSMTGGNGFQIDGGYKFSPGHFPIGLQMSYKNYNYAKYNYSESFIEPYFFVQFEF